MLVVLTFLKRIKLMAWDHDSAAFKAGWQVVTLVFLGVFSSSVAIGNDVAVLGRNLHIWRV